MENRPVGVRLLPSFEVFRFFSTYFRGIFITEHLPPEWYFCERIMPYPGDVKPPQDHLNNSTIDTDTPSELTLTESQTTLYFNFKFRILSFEPSCPPNLAVLFLDRER